MRHLTPTASKNKQRIRRNLSWKSFFLVGSRAKTAQHSRPPQQSSRLRGRLQACPEVCPFVHASQLSICICMTTCTQTCSHNSMSVYRHTRVQTPAHKHESTHLVFTHTHTATHRHIHPSIHPSVHPSMHTYTHTYIHTYMHTYIHTYIIL